MNLRRLTPKGIAAFTAYLDYLKVDPALTPPNYLLDDAQNSESVAEIEVLQRIFATRFEAAAALDDLVSAVGLPSAERDAGLWAWLALFYFDQLCPLKAGERKVGAHARYIPDTQNFQRFYRHLLVGPFLIYRAHADEPQRSLGVLATILSSPGDIVEQFASRQELIANRAVIGTVTKLYFDPESGRLKRGSGGKGAGSPRRLADIVNQFDVTYDLFSMTVGNVVALLPPEFGRFKAV